MISREMEKAKSKSDIAPSDRNKKNIVDKRSRSSVFDDKETNTLINLWGEPNILKDITSLTNKVPVVKKISKIMSLMGLPRTPEEVNARMNYLKAAYLRTKREIETGSLKTKPLWKHYEKLDALFSRPIFSAENSEHLKPDALLKQFGTDSTKNHNQNGDDEYLEKEFLEIYNDDDDSDTEDGSIQTDFFDHFSKNKRMKVDTEVLSSTRVDIDSDNIKPKEKSILVEFAGEGNINIANIPIALKVGNSSDDVTQSTAILDKKSIQVYKNKNSVSADPNIKKSEQLKLVYENKKRKTEAENVIASKIYVKSNSVKDDTIEIIESDNEENTTPKNTDIPKIVSKPQPSSSVSAVSITAKLKPMHGKVVSTTTIPNEMPCRISFAQVKNHLYKINESKGTSATSVSSNTTSVRTSANAITSLTTLPSKCASSSTIPRAAEKVSLVSRNALLKSDESSKILVNNSNNSTPRVLTKVANVFSTILPSTRAATTITTTMATSTNVLNKNQSTVHKYTSRVSSNIIPAPPQVVILKQANGNNLVSETNSVKIIEKPLSANFNTSLKDKEPAKPIKITYRNSQSADSTNTINTKEKVSEPIILDTSGPSKNIENDERPSKGGVKDFRQLLTQLVNSQLESNSINRARLQFERQKFIHEKIVADKILHALSLLRPKNE